MKTIALAALAAAALAALPATADPAPGYRVLASIKGTAVHALRSDPASRRLYAATANGVDVIDVDGERKVGQVTLPMPVTGLAVARDLESGFAADEKGSIAVFDLKTLAVARTFRTGADATAIEYDRKSRRVFVASRKAGTVTAVDAVSGKVLGSVRLGGNLRGMAADTRGHLFVADDEASVVHVVDTAALKALGTMPVWPASKPTAMLMDDKERRIYVATASGRMVVLDPDIGQVVGHVPTGQGDSGIAAQFLPNRLVRLYVPSGDGQLTVVQNKKLTASVESTLPAPGVRAAVAADEKTGKAYVANGSEVLVVGRGSVAQGVVVNKQ